MRQLAPLSATRPILSKVGALPDMLLVTVIPFLAIPEHREITTHTVTLAYIDMREHAPYPGAPPFVEEVDAERCPLGCRIMRQIARLRGASAIALQKVPAYRDLGGVMLIHARQSASARTCCREPRTRLVQILALLHLHSFAPRLSCIVQGHVPTTTASPSRLGLIGSRGRDQMTCLSNIRIRRHTWCDGWGLRFRQIFSNQRPR